MNITEGKLSIVSEVVDDAHIHTVWWNGKKLYTTKSESKIIYHLATHAGINISYKTLYELVQPALQFVGKDGEAAEANCRSIFKRIREKFQAVDPAFDEIHTYHGFGYRWGSVIMPLCGSAEAQGAVCSGKVRLYPVPAQGFWEHVPLELTVGQFQIFHELVSNAGKIRGYITLHNIARGPGFLTGANGQGYRTNIRSSIKRIREVLQRAGGDEAKACLINRASAGYIWETPS